MSGNLWMFSDKLDDEDIEILKHEFITYYQGADYYGLGLKMFTRLAHEAGAVYKIGKKVLIRRTIFDEHLRKLYRIEQAEELHKAGGKEASMRRGTLVLRTESGRMDIRFNLAQCDLNRIYDWFGVDGEILYDHAWGREPTTMADVKAYKSKSKCLSSSQVLFRDYKFNEGETIAKEMMDQLCLDMAAKKLATDSVSLYIGYSYTYGVPGVGGTAQLSSETNAAAVILPAIGALYRRMVNPSYGIRRVCLSCNNVVADHGNLQLNMFEDTTKQLRNKALQEAMLSIRAKYGKNSILRGISYTPESTARERNGFIGGHRSGSEDGKSTNAKIKTG